MPGPDYFAAVQRLAAEAAAARPPVPVAAAAAPARRPRARAMRPLIAPPTAPPVRIPMPYAPGPGWQVNAGLWALREIMR